MKNPIFLILLAGILVFTGYLLLDTFVLERVGGTALAAEPAISEEERATAEVTENSYVTDSLSVTLTEYEYLDTAVYVARVRADSPEALQTALAIVGGHRAQPVKTGGSSVTKTA